MPLLKIKIIIILIAILILGKKPKVQIHMAGIQVIIYKFMIILTIVFNKILPSQKQISNQKKHNLEDN